MLVYVQQNADYPNLQLTESPQSRNVSAKQASIVGLFQIKCLKMLIYNYIYNYSCSTGFESLLVFAIIVRSRYSYGLTARVRFPAVQDFSLFHSVQTGPEAHPPSYPVGTWGSFLGIKRPGREADHSPPSSAEVKKSGATPPHVKHREDFTVYNRTVHYNSVSSWIRI
jgi:hypothetical protein